MTLQLPLPAPTAPVAAARPSGHHGPDRLNARFATGSAEDLLAFALSGALGRVALVSSFGAEAAVLLHLASRIDPAVPVLFLDTGLLFPETLAYQRALATRLGLTDVRILRADTAAADPADRLHRADPDACCALRKSEPLERALSDFEGWISGRKRFQSGRRARLDLVELDDAGRLKLNPLAGWSAADIAAHFTRHDLPRHPLVARGYASLGCAPCTTPTLPGENPRAGRWRGSDKQECGIHFANGRPERSPR